MSSSQAQKQSLQPSSTSNGRAVIQAFLVHATTLPGFIVSQTNLHETTVAGKDLSMVLVAEGLEVSGRIDKSPVMRFFIPNSNIKCCKLA